MNSEQINIIYMFMNAGLMVQLVLITLCIFSIVSWAIVINKYRYLKRAFSDSALFIDYFWKSEDFSEVFAKAKLLSGSPVARVFGIAYLELKKLNRSGLSLKSKSGLNDNLVMYNKIGAMDNIKRALRRSITTEITKMTQKVPFLATTGSITPFIGLFGTVWGIMNSFHGIGKRGSASLAVVAPGISEALIATAMGLAVAIPAVIAFNYFNQKIRVIESELNSFSADLLNIIERDVLRSKGE